MLNRPGTRGTYISIGVVYAFGMYLVFFVFSSMQRPQHPDIEFMRYCVYPIISVVGGVAFGVVMWRRRPH